MPVNQIYKSLSRPTLRSGMRSGTLGLFRSEIAAGMQVTLGQSYGHWRMAICRSCCSMRRFWDSTTDSGVRSLLPFPFLGGTPPPLRMRSPPSPQDNTAVGDDEEHRGSGDSSMAMTLVAVHDMFLELACSSGVGPTRAKTLSAILKDAGVTNLKVLRALRARARGTICDLRVMHARNFDLSYLHDSRP